MTSDAFDLSARVASTTKDSIYVKWHVENALHPPRDLIQGFQVRYQAVGSTVVQYSHRLDASASAYDITQLHENTYYDICVKVFVRLNSGNPAGVGSGGSGGGGGGGGGGGSLGHASAQDVCVKGTTATDSLAVALGSTFGAFLALGFIVFLVFLAKWQHTRKMRKQKLVTSAYDENGVEQLRGCDDPKEMFLGSRIQFHDDLAMSEMSGQSSEVSLALYADQMPDNVDSDAGGDNGQPSSAPSSGLLPNQAEPSDFVHQWITVTSNSAPDSKEGNWLLRPPPTPGVILRPQPRQTDAEIQNKEDQRTSAASTGLPPSSVDPSCRRSREKQPAEGNGEVEENRPTYYEHSGADQEHLSAHRPLKPTASNLW